MIEALLKGKLSKKQENMEDILTSIVLGTMKYFRPEEALLPFLSNAVLLSEKNPFKNIKNVTADYEFWPQMKKKDCYACEPDVLIKLADENGENITILIEAKYQSGKSSYADESNKPNDQLAREWSSLNQIAKEDGSTPFLVYLTADFSYPFEEINESLEELKQKGKHSAKICWLSWRHFPTTAFNGIELLNDISDILRNKLYLIYFEGINTNHIDVISWKFSQAFNWSFSSKDSNWKYQ